MSADSDDEALSWDAQNDPTYVTDDQAKPAARPAKKPKQAKATRAAEATSATEPDDAAAIAADDAPTGTSSFLLVTYGIIAGAFLLYAVGWVFGLGHVNVTQNDVLTRTMSLITQGLTIAAPAIWFGGAFLITRNRPAITRLLLLIAGLVVTIPLPFILLGAAR
jgi:hypothetical protein